MRRSLCAALASVVAAFGCTLLAPSDKDLMGGNAPAGHSDDGSSDSCADENGCVFDAGMCHPTGAGCANDLECCTRACGPGGFCVPCAPSGASCSGVTTCCTGKCHGNHCQ